jgi:hypothetical protein
MLLAHQAMSLTTDYSSGSSTNLSPRSGFVHAFDLDASCWHGIIPQFSIIFINVYASNRFYVKNNPGKSNASGAYSCRVPPENFSEMKKNDPAPIAMRRLRPFSTIDVSPCDVVVSSSNEQDDPLMNSGG